MRTGGPLCQPGCRASHQHTDLSMIGPLCHVTALVVAYTQLRAAIGFTGINDKQVLRLFSTMTNTSSMLQSMNRKEKEKKRLHLLALVQREAW